MSMLGVLTEIYSKLNNLLYQSCEQFLAESTQFQGGFMKELHQINNIGCP